MPATLSIELFLQAATDVESGQYRLSAVFQEHRNALRQRRLMPTWRDIQQLRTALHELLHQRMLLERAFPHTLIGVDWVTLRLITVLDTPPEERERVVQHLFTLVEWALPTVEELYQDSQELYDFALEHIALHEVGLLSVHRQEGFLLVPDRVQRRVLVWHYRALPVVDTDQRPFLRLQPLTELPMGAIWAPEVWRSVAQQSLPRERGPTYICDADVDFPLQETLLPIAEQKLAQRVAMA